MDNFEDPTKLPLLKVKYEPYRVILVGKAAKEDENIQARMNSILPFC